MSFRRLPSKRQGRISHLAIPICARAFPADRMPRVETFQGLDTSTIGSGSSAISVLTHVSESGISANTYTYLVGPRFSANRSGRTSLFVQALVGGDRLTAGGDSAHGFSWSTGGGVEFALSHHIALRPEFDYIFLRFQNNTTHSARASVNIVFRFGGK